MVDRKENTQSKSLQFMLDMSDDYSITKKEFQTLLEIPDSDLQNKWGSLKGNMQNTNVISDKRRETPWEGGSWIQKPGKKTEKIELHQRWIDAYKNPSSKDGKYLLEKIKNSHYKTSIGIRTPATTDSLTQSEVFLIALHLEDITNEASAKSAVYVAGIMITKYNVPTKNNCRAGLFAKLTPPSIKAPTSPKLPVGFPLYSLPSDSAASSTIGIRHDLQTLISSSI